MEKGKKRGLKGLVLMSVVFILITCCFMLVACGEVETKTTSGNATIGDSENTETGTETGSDMTETGTETGGETGGEVTPDPEKSPAEYKAECEEKIVEKVSEYLSSELTRGTISNVELIKLNAKDGKVFVTADYTRGATAKCFYEMDSGLGDISGNTYKEISQKIDSSISLTDLKMDTILKSEITEEKYNDLCNYVLADVGLNGGTVLNATKFYTSKDGMPGTILTVLYNGKIATVGAYCHSATTDNTQCINEMLDPEANNDIRITSYDDFVDFDYLNNEATMS